MEKLWRSTSKNSHSPSIGLRWCWKEERNADDNSRQSLSVCKSHFEILNKKATGLFFFLINIFFSTSCHCLSFGFLLRTSLGTVSFTSSRGCHNQLATVDTVAPWYAKPQLNLAGHWEPFGEGQRH